MTKHPLTSLTFFAPADNGSGANAQATATAAPAPAAQAAPKTGNLSAQDLAARFQKQELAKLQAQQAPAAPKEPKTDTTTTPAASAEEPATAGSDADAQQVPDGTAAPDAGEQPGEDDVKPPEGLSPERAAQMQKGIDKLKTREETHRKRADSLQAELDALKQKLAAPAEPAPAAAPEPAPVPSDGNPLFSASSEDEVIARAEEMENAILAASDLLETMTAEGKSDPDDTISVRTRDGKTVEVTRGALQEDIRAGRRMLTAKDRAIRQVNQRREATAKTMQAHPDLFPGGKPSDKVLAVLNEFPELRANPKGMAAAVEIATARAAKFTKPAASKPAPTPAKPAPVATPVSAPAAAVLPSHPGPQTPAHPLRGYSSRELAQRRFLPQLMNRKP